MHASLSLLSCISLIDRPLWHGLLGALIVAHTLTLGLPQAQGASDNWFQSTPKFRITTLDGTVVTDKSLQGRGILLAFWATWCSFCRQDEQALDDLYREYRAKHLTILAIAVDKSRTDVLAYLQHRPRIVPIAVAQNIVFSPKISIRRLPLYVLVDHRGMLVSVRIGVQGRQGLRDQISALNLPTVGTPDGGLH